MEGRKRVNWSQVGVALKESCDTGTLGKVDRDQEETTYDFKVWQVRVVARSRNGKGRIEKWCKTDCQSPNRTSGFAQD